MAESFWHWHFVAAGGPVFQTVWSDGTTTALGLGAAGHFEVGGTHRVFLGPRFAVALGAWSPPPCSGPCGQGSGNPFALAAEAGVDVGYRARFGRGAVRVGPVAWLEPGLSSFGPYFGGKGGVALERGRLFLELAGGGGASFVSGAAPAPTFSLAVQVGGVAF